MIRVERTNDARLQHLWLGEAYVGAIERGQITLLPHLKPYEKDIMAGMPMNLREQTPRSGVPCARYLPTPRHARKAAKQRTFTEAGKAAKPKPEAVNSDE